MTMLKTILLSLGITGLILGYLLGSFAKLRALFTRQIKQWQEQRDAKRRSKIVYPLHLTTVTDIKKYIQKNGPQLPIAADWGDLLIELIQEMSAAGWHTEMPLWAKYEGDSYQLYVLAGNEHLQDKLTAIIESYETIRLHS
jgi:hypothetical protein